MYLKCVRENAVITVYNEKELIYTCRGYNKIIRTGWNVYDPNGQLVINYNLIDPYYAFFKGIKNLCNITIHDSITFNLVSKRNWKIIPPYTEFSTIGLNDCYTMYLQHFKNSPLVIKDSNGIVVATFDYTGFQFFDHTYEIEYEKIPQDILVSIYLLLEMDIPVSVFSKG
jgi:hypothetical protein